MRRRLVLSVVAVAGVLTVGVLTLRVARSSTSGMAEGVPGVPTARVERTALDMTVYLTGDVRASRQQAITAPAIGGSLRILSLVEGGTAVHEGDVILEFDPADQQYALEQANSQLLEAEQQIIKRRADTAVQEAQDKVALLSAQFDVRRAELDAAIDADLIPANDYRVRQVSLEEARQALARTQHDVESRATTGRAGMAVLEEQRTKAALAADRARQNIEDLVIRAPMDGIVSVRENLDASGGVLFSGMTLPSYRVGDTVNSGRPVVDLVDVSRMEIRSRVNEEERANVTIGLPVRVTSVVLPGEALSAKVTAVAGLGRADLQFGPLRQFDVTLELEKADPRLKPGTSVDLTVQGERMDAAFVVPRQAVFEKDGKPTVLVRTASGFEPHDVKVLHRTESRAAIDGVDEGTEVALVDPGLLPAAKTPDRSGGPGMQP